MMTDKRQRRLRQWEFLAGSGPKFERWRRPGPTRTLIACYFSGLALAVILLVATFAWFHFLWFYFAAIIGSMIAWTILRSTIDVKDTAPAEVIDDYEAEVLDLWRRRSFNLFGALLLIGGVGVVMVGAFFEQHIEVVTMSTFAGMYMLMLYLTVGTLPAVGYALTFNRPAPDTDED